MTQVTGHASDSPELDTESRRRFFDLGLYSFADYALSADIPELIDVLKFPDRKWAEEKYLAIMIDPNTRKDTAPEELSVMDRILVCVGADSRLVGEDAGLSEQVQQIYLYSAFGVESHQNGDRYNLATAEVWLSALVENVKSRYIVSKPHGKEDWLRLTPEGVGRMKSVRDVGLAAADIALRQD